MRRAGENSLQIDNTDHTFIELLRKYEKIILVTLGLPERPFPEHMFEAMSRLPENWLWLLRRHPLHKHKDDGIVERLKSYRINNYEIQQATEQPLYLLLEYSHHHLTDYSAVAIEALLFGVPTTFLAFDGYDYFKEYVDRGFFNYEPSSANILMEYLKH